MPHLHHCRDVLASIIEDQSITRQQQTLLLACIGGLSKKLTMIFVQGYPLPPSSNRWTKH